MKHITKHGAQEIVGLLTANGGIKRAYVAKTSAPHVGWLGCGKTSEK